MNSKRVLNTQTSMFVVFKNPTLASSGAKKAGHLDTENCNTQHIGKDNKGD